MKTSLCALTIALWLPIAAQAAELSIAAQAAELPTQKPEPTSRDQIKAGRAKADTAEKSDPSARPWDRDANGKRPWERNEPSK